MKVLLGVLTALILMAGQSAHAFDSRLTNLIQVGTAFVTNLSVHEYGHAVVGSSVGADGISVSFFKKEKNNLFLGYTAMQNIDDRSYPSFALGGEIGANMSFEYALHSFRRQPTIYNQSLMLFSGTDFLWYSIYTFYFNKDNPEADPNILNKETGVSKDIILSIAITQSLLNSYRVLSGTDRVIPYFSYDRHSVGFHLKFPF